MKNVNKIFIICYIIIIITLFLSIFRKPKEYSILENREMNKMKIFNYIDYIKGNFQKNFEEALADQLIGSETIKKKVNSVMHFSGALTTKGLLCKNKYLLIGKTEDHTYYNYNCEKRLLYGANINVDEQKKQIIKILDSYVEANNNYDMYFYYIPTSLTYNFILKKEVVSAYDIIKKNKKYNFKIDYLKYDNYDDYKKLFYATDHHWNYYGSYQGYKDIHQLLELKDDIIRPIDEITFNFDFLGSGARLLQFDKFKEKFKVYKFNYPEHTAIISDNNEKYGKQEEYFSGVYNDDKYTNHYGDFYGWDYKEVIIHYNNKSKENLMIISDSFSNAINELIASHFNTTYVVDLRVYNDFIINEYIKEKEIDKILFVMDSGTYFKDDYFILKG